MNEKTYPCNYEAAVKWLNGDLILCNEIAANGRSHDFWFKGWSDEDCMNTKIFQWYLTNYDDNDVDWLMEHFNLKFAYDHEFELWILCVTHYGTSWDYVYWETDIKQASCGLGELPRAL